MDMEVLIETDMETETGAWRRSLNGSLYTSWKLTAFRTGDGDELWVKS